MAGRWTAFGILDLALGIFLLAGCQGYEVPYNQKIVVQLHETTSENPASATIAVDGKDVFGPGDILPGDTKTVTIHDPASNDPMKKLTAGQVHRISWKLSRNGMPGKTGSLDMTILSGDKQMIKSSFPMSTRYTWPMGWVQGYVDIKLTGAGPGGAAAPPPPAGTSPPPATTPPARRPP